MAEFEIMFIRMYSSAAPQMFQCTNMRAIELQLISILLLEKN